MMYTLHVNLVTDMVAITMVFPLVVCVYKTIKTLKTVILFMASKGKFLNLMAGYIIW